MNWTLKYRPHQVKDLHLTPAREQLLKLMADGYIPPVLLFAGPKGTGKTSSSRLVAAVLNDPSNAQLVDQVYFQHQKPNQSLNEPSKKNSFINKILIGQSYTVAEIDAASHRGIDDIRELKERAFLPPVEGKMSVFILDEVHMLTTPAFNALLKLLEEPPQHAVFILATTEPEKIPETVISRCQVVRFRRANSKEILRALNQVVKQEKLTAEAGSLELIAQLADGSFRDAIKYLELARDDNQVRLEQVEHLVGRSLTQEAENFLELILTKDKVGLAQLFTDLRERHADEKVFLTTFVKLLHQQLLQSFRSDSPATGINQTVALFLLQHFNRPELLESVIPFLAIELEALELVERSQKNKRPKVKTPKAKPSAESVGTKQSRTNKVEKAKINQSKTINFQLKTLSAKPKIRNLDSKIQKSDLGDGQAVIGQWEKLLNLIEQKNSTIAALLRSAKPTRGDKGKVVVEVYYRFHQEQLTNPKIVNLIQDALKALSLGFVEFEFILKEPNRQINSGDVINHKLAPTPAVINHQKETNLVDVASRVLM